MELTGYSFVSSVGVDEMRNRPIDPLFPLSDYWKASPRGSSIGSESWFYCGREHLINAMNEH